MYVCMYVCVILYCYAYLNASCDHLFKKFLKLSGKAFVALLAEGSIYLFFDLNIPHQKRSVSNL